MPVEEYDIMTQCSVCTFVNGKKWVGGMSNKLGRVSDDCASLHDNYDDFLHRLRKIETFFLLSDKEISSHLNDRDNQTL